MFILKMRVKNSTMHKGTPPFILAESNVTRLWHMILCRNFKHLLLRCIPGGYKDPEIPLKLRCNKDVTFRFCKSMVFSFTLNTFKLAYDKLINQVPWCEWLSDCRISERWLISKIFKRINDNHTKSNHGCPSDENRSVNGERIYIICCNHVATERKEVLR